MALCAAGFNCLQYIHDKSDWRWLLQMQIPTLRQNQQQQRRRQSQAHRQCCLSRHACVLFKLYPEHKMPHLCIRIGQTMLPSFRGPSLAGTALRTVF